MIPAATVAAERNEGSGAPVCTREEVLARYRRWRAISKRHHDEVLNFVSSSAMLQQARRLGMSDGRRLFLDNLEAIDLVYDLLVYTAPAGRSRALDRFARNVPPPAGSDEALVLDAMRDARFAILKMQRRHPAAGLILTDDARSAELWLVDEGYETWFEKGRLVATRYFTPGPFSMTTGVAIPTYGELITRTLVSVPQLLRKPNSTPQVFDDPRFAEALYRTAIEAGVMERVRYRDPPAGGYASLT